MSPLHIEHRVFDTAQPTDTSLTIPLSMASISSALPCVRRIYALAVRRNSSSPSAVRAPSTVSTLHEIMRAFWFFAVGSWSMIPVLPTKSFSSSNSDSTVKRSLSLSTSLSHRTTVKRYTSSGVSSRRLYVLTSAISASISGAYALFITLPFFIVHLRQTCFYLGGPGIVEARLSELGLVLQADVVPLDRHGRVQPEAL